MKSIFIFFFCLLCNLACLHLSAQEKEFILKNFTQEDGLPSNEAYNIFEDSRHYIWAATDLGVVRYNGKKFEQFDLPDNVVFKIKEDSKGRIWFFSHTAQLAYFENEKVHAYKYNAAIRQRIKKIEIIEAYIDSAENITLNSSIDSNYVISANGEIQAYNTSVMTRISTVLRINFFNEKNCSVQKLIAGGNGSDSLILNVNWKGVIIRYAIPSLFYPSPHYGLETDSKGNIFFFGGNMLIKLNRDGSYVFKKMLTDIFTLHIIGEELWVGMRKGGGVAVDKTTLKKTGNYILPDKSVSCIRSDYEGGLWCSTLENGIYYAKNTQLFRIKNPEQINADVSRMLNVKDSMLIYCDSYGLHKMMGLNNSVFLKLPYFTCNDLFTDQHSVLYFLGNLNLGKNTFEKSSEPAFKYIYKFPATSEGIFKKDTIIYSVSNAIYKFKADFNAWIKMKIFLDSNLLFKKNRILDKPSKPFLDHNMNIWAGNNDGLYKSNGNWDSLPKFKPSSALLNRGVNCIRQMDNGVIIAGIRQGGIALIKDTNIIATVSEATGLLSNKIKYLLPLGDQLWVATAKGISIIVFTSYNPVKYSITQIGKNDGFFNLTINQLIRFKGDIVAATSNGLYFINNPDKFLNRTLPVIPFYINSVSSNGIDTGGVTSITLPYSKNRLLIKYSAISFNVADEISYLYRLDSSDSSWSATNNNELLIENLKPGVYNFQIKAVAVNQERSSDIISLNITIEKPWWQNNWLRLALAIVVPLLVYLYFKKRIGKIRAEEKRKTTLYGRIHELEQAAFRAQMNPHFIFNCLTSIQQLILNGNKLEASEYLVKFARLIRKTMDLSLVPFITIKGEIEYLTEYLMLEQLRMPDQFTYTLTLSNIDRPEKIEIPNMMLQPLIENSIRHGIKPLEGRKGLITVHFELSKEFVTCTVTDNGIGRDTVSDLKNNLYAEHKSYGLDIIKKRLTVITEVNQVTMNFEIKDLYLDNGLPGGTKVSIQLPYKYKT